MEAKKISAKKIQGDETKKKICENAALLFKEYGYDNVSVDSIVEKAGISKGGFYVHFDSKDSLTSALIAEYVSKLDLSYKAFLETFSDSTKASVILQSFVGKIADVMTDSIGYSLIKITYRIQIDRTISTGTLLSYSREIYGVFIGLIQQGIRQGEFKAELDAKMTADQFVTVLRGFTYEWCIRYPEFHLKDELLRHFNLLLFGISR